VNTLAARIALDQIGNTYCLNKNQTDESNIELNCSLVKSQFGRDVTRGLNFQVARTNHIQPLSDGFKPICFAEMGWNRLYDPVTIYKGV